MKYQNNGQEFVQNDDHNKNEKIYNKLLLNKYMNLVKKITKLFKTKPKKQTV